MADVGPLVAWSAAALAGPHNVAPDTVTARAAMHGIQSQRYYTSTTNGTVSGIAKELGVAVAGKKVAAFDSRTDEFLGSAISAGDGTYSINCLGRNLVYVVAFDSPYNLLGLDRVVPG